MPKDVATSSSDLPSLHLNDLTIRHTSMVLESMQKETSPPSVLSAIRSSMVLRRELVNLRLVLCVIITPMAK